MRLEGLLKYFSNIEKRLSKHILLLVEAMIKSVSSNTAQIALALSQLEQKSYKASDIQITKQRKISSRKETVSVPHQSDI